MGNTRITVYTPTAEELRSELRAVNLELKYAYDKFNRVCDPDLVEASIYEINALNAKCNYLLRRIKELTTPAPQASRSASEPLVAAAAMKGGPVCPS